MASYGTLAASTLVLVLGSVVPTGPAFGQAAQDTVAVTLQAVGNSGVSGSAVLRARGRETDFDYSLTATDQARQRQEYNLWLREGSCAAPGRKLDDLDEVRADGRPEREDEEVALSDLLATEHVLQVRVEDRDEVVACGAIRRDS